MFNTIVGGVALIIGGALLSSLYQNKLLAQVDYEMINGDININEVNFMPRNIITENINTLKGE